MIDGDSIAYILGWEYREQVENPDAETLMRGAVHTYLSGIFKTLDASHYLGVLTSAWVFRTELYRYAPYKGNRPPADPWLVFWKPLVASILIEDWDFQVFGGLEADDVLSMVRYSEVHALDPVYCSPDKDLRQLSGKHYNYSKPERGLEEVSQAQADKTFYRQVLMGDDGDNVKGLPGIGEKRAFELLKGIEDPIHMDHLVHIKYLEYFGEYYGEQILGETKFTLMLMCPHHMLWDTYKKYCALWRFKETPVNSYLTELQGN